MFVVGILLSTLLFGQVLAIHKEIFTTNNIKVVRPGLGLPPKYYNDMLGKRANKFIKLGKPIGLKDFKYKK